MNNPEALVIAFFGLFLIIVGMKNKGDNLIAAATGKGYKKSSLK